MGAHLDERMDVDRLDEVGRLLVDPVVRRRAPRRRARQDQPALHPAEHGCGGSEEHAPYGKMIDNHSKMKPVYFEERDRGGRVSATRALHTLLRQNPACKDARFTARIRIVAVYELQRIQQKRGRENDNGNLPKRARCT